MTNENSATLSTEILSALAERSEIDAIQLLRARSLDDVETILALATLALDDAEVAPDQSAHWLGICRGLNASSQNELIGAQINYAQARLDLIRGDLASAEQNIVRAQNGWRISDDSASIARSNLGLTQIFAMQGRYDEAEETIQQAITYFEQASENAEGGLNSEKIPTLFRLIGARRNLANLYGYQDRHEAALLEFAKIANTIDQIQAHAGADAEVVRALQEERAHRAISESLSFAHLDQIDQAESTLFEALSIFELDKERIYRGQIHSNLGSIYLRMGRYSAALTAFEQAGKDLGHDEPNFLGDLDGDEERLFGSSTMLLDQATAYVSLNLLSEAENALLKCESIFRIATTPAESGQYMMPYELGQTLFGLGQVYARQEAWQQAESAILEAEQIFDSIDNPYWLNQCRLALAASAYLQNDSAASVVLLDDLVRGAQSGDGSQNGLGTIAWDVNLLTNVRLLRLRIHVDANELDFAEQLATQIESTFGPTGGFSHLQLRLLHARGLIAQAAGDLVGARTYFLQAIRLLESQRATLLIEEVRSAFIIDKSDIYTDFVLNLLSAMNGQTHDDRTDDVDEPVTDELVSEVFAIIERARSRTLLERLLASLPDEDVNLVGAADTDVEGAEQSLSQSDKLRRELHWLYNRLLGQDGVRRMDVGLTQQIQSCEKELQQLEWQASPALQQAEPVELETLQRALGVEQQAVVYYIANDEVMAFVVSRTAVEFERKICTKTELSVALRDLRFQLGRFQVGAEYVQRHAERLQKGIDGCLQRLYQLVIDPLRHHLTMPRIQIIPFGIIHLIPFHALYDGSTYMVELFECSYAPSASIAVTCHTRSASQMEFSSLASLGITDDLIPEARNEVECIAKHFATVTSYLDEQASRDNLTIAASEADILHIATHGLYRSDNPFFSSLKLADGWIDVREIYRLPLRARLVVLSACESGNGYVQDGDEVIGLARGFLGAGAHALVVSMWNVHDATAAQQMDSFYNVLQNEPDFVRPAAALRQAQLVSIAQGQHPYYWAPFSVIG